MTRMPSWQCLENDSAALWSVHCALSDNSQTAIATMAAASWRIDEQDTPTIVHTLFVSRHVYATVDNDVHIMSMCLS